MRHALMATAVMAGLLGAPAAFAAPDWSKVQAKQFNVFYPGVASMEWMLSTNDHSGARGYTLGIEAKADITAARQ